MPFAGSLGTLPLPDILNTLHNIHASGVLRLVSRVGSRDVVFQGGEIIGVGMLDAERSEATARRMSLLSQAGVDQSEQYEEERQQEALSQVFNLFAWHDAEFAFSPAGAETPEIQQLVAVCQIRPLSLNIQHVLMEAARQQDEWAALRARIEQESSGKGTAAIAAASAEELTVDVDAGEAAASAPGLALVAGSAVEDQEWGKPILSDEELAPTPWGGDGAAPSAGGQARTPPQAVTASHSPSPSPSPSPPTTTIGGAMVGPYRLSATLELLNGQAYRGRHVQERTEVAIKLAPAELFRGEQGLNEALHQARLLAAVHHPSLIACLGVGTGGGGLYTAFTSRPGDDCAQMVERSGGPLAEEAVIRLALDGAFALQALHHRALVHRDLRPDNVFIAGDGRAILGPFALVDAPGPDAPASERGRLVAEWSGFIAPEVVQGVLDVDHRADVYALAGIMFFLATGQPPYHGANRHELARAILNRPLPRIRDSNRHISEGLDALVSLAMAKERQGRPQSIDALIAELQVLDVSQTPGARIPGDEDSSASTYPAISTAALTASPPMTRRHPSSSTSSSTRIVTATMGATTGVARRNSTRITAAMPAGDSRRAMVPQPQPITSILVQPPPEPSPPPSRAWGIYDLALVALVAATVFWVVISQSPSAPAGTSAALAAPAPGRGHLPAAGLRLDFHKGPWADWARDGTVAVTGQGAVFTGKGLLRTSGQALSRALVAAGDFSLSLGFTAAQAAPEREGRLLAIAHSPLIVNLTLGQVGSGLVARLRTSGGDATGTPIATPQGLITGARQRLVLVHASGRATIYLDGVAVGWSAAPGDLSTWAEGSPLHIGADANGVSPWSGTIHDLTIWPRALSQQDVAALDAEDGKASGVP